MPPQETFWAEFFGMTVDRYGVPWLVDDVWDGPEVAAFAGAERLLRFHPERWRFAEYSALLRSTGVWPTPRGT